MKIIEATLPGLIVIKPNVLQDSRGYFLESFQQTRYLELGIPAFVQDNVSRSKHNVLRGLHFQLPQAQGKLVSVTYGAVFDVAVDIRVSSPTFGKWFGIELSEENHMQMYIPPGFAHGFCVLSEIADFHYKCTNFYSPGSEKGIAWNDPSLSISWPSKNPILSPKDMNYPSLPEMSHEQLFT